MMENQELAVKAAKTLGCVLVNIAAVDLVNGEVGKSSPDICHHAHTII